jgi:hypothetical protein
MCQAPIPLPGLAPLSRAAITSDMVSTLKRTGLLPPGYTGPSNAGAACNVSMPGSLKGVWHMSPLRLRCCSICLGGGAAGQDVREGWDAVPTSVLKVAPGCGLDMLTHL